MGGLAEELGLGVEETAAGIVRVASAAMAQAVRVVTVERGIDPRDLALVPFGGAGPLHAAQIADELGMRRVLVPVASGVLSAFGLVVAERRRDLVRERPPGRRRPDDRRGSPRRWSAWPTGAAPSCRGEEPEVRATYELRYEGQAFELPVDGDPRPDPADLRRAFDRAHEDRYGHSEPAADLELVTIRVAVALPVRNRAPPSGMGCRGAGRGAGGRARCPARPSSSPRAGAPAPSGTSW